MSIRSQLEAQAARAIIPAVPPSRWPSPRHDMTDVAAIRERFAEDAELLLAARGCDDRIERADFALMGWTAAQIEAHGQHGIACAAHALGRSLAGN